MQCPGTNFPACARPSPAGACCQPMPRAAVAETLNVVVAKMSVRDDDPRQGITDYLRKPDRPSW